MTRNVVLTWTRTETLEADVDVTEARVRAWHDEQGALTGDRPLNTGDFADYAHATYAHGPNGLLYETDGVQIALSGIVVDPAPASPASVPADGPQGGLRAVLPAGTVLRGGPQNGRWEAVAHMPEDPTGYHARRIAKAAAGVGYDTAFASHGQEVVISCDPDGPRPVRD